MEALETELKRLIVDTLSLKDVSPDQIASDSPLIGEGLGLDSIDALELAMAIGKRYSVKFASGDAKARAAFANVQTLATYINQNRAAAA